MSASKSPVRHPARDIAIARLHATELLPTPPLPLITSTTCFTFGSGSSGPTARAGRSRGGVFGFCSASVMVQSALSYHEQLSLGHLLDGEPDALASQPRVAGAAVG